jgi:lipoprotein-anchoring transpeptidase ErfK/SrfK
LEPPPGLLPGERWLDVDLGSQTLVAYEGDAPIFATLVSTGRGPDGSEEATPRGAFHIWVKLLSTDMTNLEDPEASRYYAIEDVPWVMFFKDGYGLHGAFWHRSFGNERSHGCINLSPLDAQRLFRWATPRLPSGFRAARPTAHDSGTLVVVR